MEVSIAGKRLELTKGDITLENVDAIVNAANSRLAGGGGVDGAIHRRGGPAIMEETRRRYPDGCPTGSAVISSAGNLAARFVIHAVGPVWSGGRADEEPLLRRAYRRSLELARDADCHSIAFPALSTGAYRYPIDLAARAALGSAMDWLKDHDEPGLVRFVLFSDEAYIAFANALEELLGEHRPEANA
jgi:O-acetyl-ADP-ribose deacetylase (regulator of RNase III)